MNQALSKGPQTTTWVWHLHNDAHDYHSSGRKVFSSNLAHLSLVFFWITGMQIHGAYFSNYTSWLKDPKLKDHYLIRIVFVFDPKLKDPKHYLPCAHLVWSLIGQDILNSDTVQGISITSGLFQLWREQGFINIIHLKYGACASLFGTLISLNTSHK